MLFVGGGGGAIRRGKKNRHDKKYRKIFLFFFFAHLTNVEGFEEEKREIEGKISYWWVAGR